MHCKLFSEMRKVWELKFVIFSKMCCLFAYFVNHINKKSS